MNPETSITAVVKPPSAAENDLTRTVTALPKTVVNVVLPVIALVIAVDC